MPIYPKKGAAPAPMVREERAEAKMGKAAYARHEAAESPAKKAAESAKGYACGGKVKGHADGGVVGFFKGVVEKATRPKPAAKTEPLTAVPAPKKEPVPEEPSGPGMSAPAAAEKLHGIVNRNRRALKAAEEVDDPK